MSTPHPLTALLSLLLCSCGQSQSPDAPMPSVVDTGAVLVPDKAPERREEEVPYGPFGREELRGGYHVLYTVVSDTFERDGSVAIEPMQSAQLWEEETLIAEINSCSYGLPEKNLGYVMNDFADCFIFVQGYGPCNPVYAQVIEKKSGLPIIDGYADYLDADTVARAVLLDWNARGEGKGNDSLLLFNVDTKSFELFPRPGDNDGTMWYCSTSIASLTRDRLVIQYEARPDGTKRAGYRRR